MKISVPCLKPRAQPEGPGSGKRIVFKKTYAPIKEARTQVNEENEALEGERGYDSFRGYGRRKGKRGRIPFIYVID